MTRTCDLFAIFCCLSAIGGGCLLVPVARMAAAERMPARALGRLLVINGGIQ